MTTIKPWLRVVRAFRDVRCPDDMAEKGTIDQPLVLGVTNMCTYDDVLRSRLTAGQNPAKESQAAQLTLL